MLTSGFLLAVGLYGEDLWRDHNPYSSVSTLAAGSILKMDVDEPVLIEYDYDATSDEKAQIKLVPDKGITDFLPAANEDRSFNNQSRIRIRSKGRVKFQMAVTVAGVQGESIELRGARQLVYENGRARQEFQISGRVNRRDIASDRTVHSRSVADLQILLRGSPIPQTRNIPLRQIPGAPGQPARTSAELSDQDKQQILLEYLNRILGETRSQ